MVHFGVENGERGGGIEKSWKNSLVLLLYLYIEAINSQFYEHLLMITAGINDLRRAEPEPQRGYATQYS